jgi:hypothetical protein
MCQYYTNALQCSCNALHGWPTSPLSDTVHGLPDRVHDPEGVVIKNASHESDLDDDHSVCSAHRCAIKTKKNEVTKNISKIEWYTLTKAKLYQDHVHPASTFIACQRIKTTNGSYVVILCLLLFLLLFAVCHFWTNKRCILQRTVSVHISHCYCFCVVHTN